MQVGKLGGKNAAATTSRTSAASPRSGSIPKTNEAYVADGYRNKRVAVLDADTGKMKRYWGAYGNKPDDADLGQVRSRRRRRRKQFRNPVHCVERAERRPASTSATGRTTASRCSSPTARS